MTDIAKVSNGIGDSYSILHKVYYKYFDLQGGAA